MLMQSFIFSKPVSPSFGLAQRAFARAAGQHVQAAERLLETWSIRALKPANAIGGLDYISEHPGLVWSGMN